jgi:tetrapyrrole methylase family protein/MazG family protein
MRDLEELLRVLRQLRGENGCPWDRKQTMASLCSYVIEEAYELHDTADLEDLEATADELGDVLFMVLSCALLLEDRGGPDLMNVAARARDKIVRRHPHVFADRQARTAEEGARHWREMKDDEARSRGEEPPPFLGKLPRSLPALRRALAVQRKVAEVGFEWETATQVYAKLLEESRELHEVLPLGDAARVRDELGDMLFSIVNLARFLAVDPEAALTGTVEKFAKRFHYIERRLRERGVDLHQATLAEMDALWEEAKRLDASRDSDPPGADTTAP